MFWIIVIVAIIVIYRIVKPYIQKHDTVILYTGGLGSGKSLISSSMALRLLRKNRAIVKWHNFFHPFSKWERPELYSNIAFKVKKNEWALKLTPEHMTLQAHIIPRSVVFVDEICLFLDQFSIKLPASSTVEEFATLFRHYTVSGYLVMNTQNSNKVNFHFRYCVNSAINLSYFKKWLPWNPLWLFSSVKVRNISLADDIKRIEEGNREDSMSTLLFFRPMMKHYDTHTYSCRYDSVPRQTEKRYSQFKTGVLMTCPRGKVVPKTSDVYFDEEGMEGLKGVENSVTTQTVTLFPPPPPPYRPVENSSSDFTSSAGQSD